MKLNYSSMEGPKISRDRQGNKRRRTRLVDYKSRSNSRRPFDDRPPAQQCASLQTRVAHARVYTHEEGRRGLINRLLIAWPAHINDRRICFLYIYLRLPPCPRRGQQFLPVVARGTYD